jgi:hypothetical protein
MMLGSFIIGTPGTRTRGLVARLLLLAALAGTVGAYGDHYARERREIDKYLRRRG